MAKKGAPVSQKGCKPGYPTTTERIAKTVPSPNYPRSNFKGSKG